MPASRLQPTCRLGMAAYWFVTFSGGSVRDQPVCSRIVSTRLGSTSRGGATGSRAKKRKPIRPETKTAFRSRAYGRMARVEEDRRARQHPPEAPDVKQT